MLRSGHHWHHNQSGEEEQDEHKKRHSHTGERMNHDKGSNVAKQDRTHEASVRI